MIIDFIDIVNSESVIFAHLTFLNFTNVFYILVRDFVCGEIFTSTDFQFKIHNKSDNDFPTKIILMKRSGFSKKIKHIIAVTYPCVEIDF